MTRRNLPFYLLVAGAYALLTIPRMAQAGMFLDGVTYASTARNLALGLGTFWAPHYTSTVFPQLWEHPPLGFALQALPFLVFGDHLAVERAYSFVFGAVTALAMMGIWRVALQERDYDWVPLVFWLLPSTVTWSIVNNLLETTQTAFTTVAVLAFVLSLRSSSWAWSSLFSGLLVFAAALTKGPTGLFPLAAPAIAIALRLNHRRALQAGAVMIATLLAACALTLAFESARVALHAWWTQQLFASVSGARGGGRWYDLFRHLQGIITRMSLLLVLVSVRAWWGRTRSVASVMPSRERVWFFGLLALAASIPLAMSGRVMGHYLVPSIPIYALFYAGLTVWLWRADLDAWLGRASVRKATGVFGALLLVLAAVFPFVGVTLERRDVEKIAAYRAIEASLPRGETIGICDAAREDWGTHAYMQRLFRVSLDADRPEGHRFFLQLKDRPCAAPAACRERTNAGLLALYACP